MVWEESTKKRPRPQSIIHSLCRLYYIAGKLRCHFVAPEQSVFSKPAGRQSDQWWDGDGRKFWRKKKNEADSHSQSSFLAARGSRLCSDHNTPSTPSHGNLEAREGSRLFLLRTQDPLSSLFRQVKTQRKRKLSFPNKMLPNQMTKILSTLARIAALRACWR